jgi:hypothetical protein
MCGMTSLSKSIIEKRDKAMKKREKTTNTMLKARVKNA